MGEAGTFILNIAANAAEKTNSGLVEVRGHVFILFRKRRVEEEPSQ
jgi:RNA-binding protein YhbY